MKKIILTFSFMTLALVAMAQVPIQHYQASNTNAYHGIHPTGYVVPNIAGLQAVTNMWCGDTATELDNGTEWVFQCTAGPAPPIPGAGFGIWSPLVQNYMPTTVTASGQVTISYADPNNVNYFLDAAGNTITPSLGGTGLLGIGIFNLSHNTTGTYNTAVGVESMADNTTGSWNTGFGYQPLFFNTTGNENTGVGYSALLANTTGNNNTGVGANSLLNSTIGSSNAAFGYYSLVGSVTGSDNTAIGFAANENVTNGSNNTALGFQALASGVTESGSIGIGKDAGYYSINSNEFYLGNQDWGSNTNEKNDDLMFGTMAPTPTNDTLNTPGKLTAQNYTSTGSFVTWGASIGQTVVFQGHVLYSINSTPVP